MEFEQEPDYNYLKHLFSLILTKENQKNDLKFVWINKKERNFILKNDENNKSKKRDIHKRLYNSIKVSLEKKKSGRSCNTLESYNLKSDLSIDKYNDIQKKVNEKRNYTLIDLENRNNNIKSGKNININLNNKNLIELSKLPIKKSSYNTNNNFENKFKFYTNDSHADNSSLINQESNKNININSIAFNYYSHVPKVKVKKYSIKKFRDNIWIRNINLKRKINIIDHNYSNIESNISNKSQNQNSIISDYSYNYKNDYYNKIGNQIKKKNNMNYTSTSIINYRLKDRNLLIQNKKNKIKKINNTNPVEETERTFTSRYSKDIHYKPKYSNLSSLD